MPQLEHHYPLSKPDLTQFETFIQAAASPLPTMLFPRFKKARAALLAAFKDAIAYGVLQGTVAEAVYRSSGVCILPFECQTFMLCIHNISYV